MSRSATAVDLALAGDVGAHDDELVAAHPADGVARAHGGRHALGRLDEHEVAGAVAERVVDDLEPVEVADEHADAAVGAGRQRQR